MPLTFEQPLPDDKSTKEAKSTFDTEHIQAAGGSEDSTGEATSTFEPVMEQPQTKVVEAEPRPAPKPGPRARTKNRR